MRNNLTTGFTMRKDGILPRGDWFNFVDEGKAKPKVYIYDEIGFWGTDASDFVTQLGAIDADEFELHLNSPGGEIFDGLAIYNAIKQHKAFVTVYVDGLAASAASFIAQAGDKVVMARNAQMMIHDGIAFAYGNEQDMLDTAGLLSQLSNNIADIYSFRSGKRGDDFGSTEDFRALMRQEVWYNGAEAVSAGLADEVLDADDEEAENAKNKWDLSFYNHAGREKAESPLRLQEKIRLDNRQKGTTEMNQPNPKAPKATTDPEVTPAPVPETTPPAEPEGTPEPAEQEPAEQPPAAAPAAAPAPENKAQGVMIDGKMVTDWSVINTHFAALNTAQAEQRATHRKSVVEGLAVNNKIGAPQIDSLVALVNGDPEKGLPPMSDEQFAAFSASYESAPASTLFEQYASSQATPGSQVPGSPQADAERISVLEGVVAMHGRTMTADKVKETKSYKELQELRAATNNQNQG